MRRSFTLIELIVVLAIMAIILSIAVFKVSSLYTITEENEIDSFVEDLNYARRLSLTQKNDISIIVYEDGRGYQIKNLKNSKIEKDVDLDMIRIIDSSNGRPLVFKARGTVANATTYRIEGIENKYHISVQVATGKVNLKMRW